MSGFIQRELERILERILVPALKPCNANVPGAWCARRIRCDVMAETGGDGDERRAALIRWEGVLAGL